MSGCKPKIELSNKTSEFLDADTSEVVNLADFTVMLKSDPADPVDVISEIGRQNVIHVDSDMIALTMDPVTVPFAIFKGVSAVLGPIFAIVVGIDRLFRMNPSPPSFVVKSSRPSTVARIDFGLITPNAIRFEMRTELES